MLAHRPGATLFAAPFSVLTLTALNGAEDDVCLDKHTPCCGK